MKDYNKYLITIYNMKTLLEEVIELEQKWDIVTLTRMKEIMEDTRESTSRIMEHKQDMWLSCGKEYWMILTATENIRLINNSIQAILKTKQPLKYNP